MKHYTVIVQGKFPLHKTFSALSLQDALGRVKSQLIQPDASWDMCPIWTGEKRLDTTFKIDGKSYKVVITCDSFGKGVSHEVVLSS